MDSDTKTITIAGGGLVGALFALLWARRGYRIRVYEKRADLRRTHAEEGRSINLALSERGWKALALAGASETIRQYALPMKGRMVHDEEGKTVFRPYGKPGQAIYSVSRRVLNEVLLQMAEDTGNVELCFNNEVKSVDLNTSTIAIQDLLSGRVYDRPIDFIIGADGAGSPVRQALYRQIPATQNESLFIDHGYKELHLAPAADGKHRIDAEALHIWPRKSFMLIALPNVDGSFTCTLFLPLKGPVSFESLQTETETAAFFLRHFPDACSLIPDIAAQYISKPVSNLGYVQCSPYGVPGKALLIGDAAHAIVPFYGQGMNAGFEDCSLLHDLADTHKDDLHKISAEFMATRKPDADAIAALALQNFIEMRDLVANPDFIFAKKVETIVDELLGDKWTPQYSMVSFSHIPYSQALSMGQMHRDFIAKMIQDLNLSARHETASPEIKMLIEGYVKEKYLV